MTDPPPSAGPSTTAATRSIIDETVARLTTDDALVGQLLLLGWEGSSADDARTTLSRLRPAGVVFLANATRADDARVINADLVALAAELGLPPLIRAVDHEGGVVQRIKDVPNLGSNRDFARSRPSDADACQRGQRHAAELRRMGFTMDLAPVLDVDTNARNPVIGSRSYGARPDLVARLGAAYIRGLQRGGLAAVGKHFPGHGATDVDSHLGLPVLRVPRSRLDAVELVPFRRVLERDIDVAGIMTGHISLPRIDASGVPATLSRVVVNGILREDLGFDGLVVSDDLGAMQAVTDRFPAGEAAVRAVEAGVDLLIIVGPSARQQAASDALVDALRTGRLSRADVEASVRRVLAVKQRFGGLGGAQPPAQPC